MHVQHFFRKIVFQEIVQVSESQNFDLSNQGISLGKLVALSYAMNEKPTTTGDIFVFVSRDMSERAGVVKEDGELSTLNFGREKDSRERKKKFNFCVSRLSAP